ncbi:MAG TPA: glycosyltransferase [Candidatus Binatia bacterium]|jgi:glycosyltransferase involved in cell wall biosynthesis
MKILYFIDHLRPDGTQMVLCQLVEGFAKRRYSQSVICLNDTWDRALVERLRRAGANVRIVGKLALASGYNLFLIWRSLCRARYDVVVTLLFYSDIVGRTLARAAKVPRIVTTLQARNIHYTSLQRWLVRKTMRWADAVIICSERIREFAISGEGASPERISYIPHAVRSEDYQVSGDQGSVRAELCTKNNVVIMGTIGRLTYQKGFDILLQALWRVQTFNYHLFIIGVGEEDRVLKKRVEEIGLQSRVSFLGYRRDVPRLLSAIDLYVQPSRFEGMPLAVLEAMAAACPIVATAVDGISELIEDGKQGWLVPPEDPISLGQAIEQALCDRAEARRRGIAARQRVVVSYSVDRMIMAWDKVLRGSD